MKLEPYMNYEEDAYTWATNRTNLKINFICMDLGINGGTKSIISIANALTDLGHEVNVIYPKWVFPSIFNKKTLKEGIGMPIMRIKRELLGQSVSEKTLQTFNAKCNVIKARRLTDKYIPDADFTFATWWETAPYVKKLSDSKGKKCYLIQHCETWGGNPDFVLETYRYGFLSIVHSTWLKNEIKRLAYIDTNACILHCPEHDQFYFTNQRREYDSDIMQVMMIYRNIKWKGMEYGLKAFEIAREKLAKQNINLILNLVGEKPNFELKPYMSYFPHPETKTLNEIYNFSDIFLFPSLEEGFGLPPMEAMCCKLPIVTTNVGAIPDYGTDGHNMLICKYNKYKELGWEIIRLAKNKSLREKLSSNAYNDIQKYTWENYAKKLVEVLKNAKR